MLGLAGALLMLAGDMLLYAHAAPADPGLEAGLGARSAILGAGRAELFVSGLIGPLAAVLYAFGFRHIHLHLRRHAPAAGAFVALALVVMMAIGGAYHAMWSHYGFILQAAAADPAGTAALVDNATDYMRAMYVAAAMAGYPGALVLLVLVVAGKSDWPRWTALANPGLIIALAPLAAPQAGRLPAPGGAMLTGGWINLAFVLFFIVSLTTTWRGGGSAVR